MVVGSLLYVYNAEISESEKRSLAVSSLLTLLREHMTVSIAATLLTCAVAIPLGIALTRGRFRRYSKPIITVAGFGQAAPAIGLIALGAVLFGIGQVGAIIALTVYGALPIIANTVTGLDGVDPRLVEASRGMGMSAWSTLLRIELPLALPVIVAGVRTALVLIVGTAALASFTGRGRPRPTHHDRYQAAADGDPGRRRGARRRAGPLHRLVGPGRGDRRRAEGALT